MPRLRFELSPDEVLCAMRQLYDALDDEEQTHEVFLETLLEPLESVHEHACGWIEQLDALLGELTADRRDGPLDLHYEEDEDEFFENIQIGLHTDALAGWPLLRRFAGLLDHLGETEAHGYRLRVYLGGRRSSLAVARARVDEALASSGQRPRQGERRRRQRRREDRRPRDAGAAGRHQQRAGQGRYGGLGGDEPGQARQQQRHTRTEQARRPPRDELVEAFCHLAGVDFPCPPRDLDRAYRRAALRHHPDHNQGDPEAAGRFILLTQAYQRCRELAQQRV